MKGPMRWFLPLLLLCVGCTAQGGAMGLRGADMAGHLSGYAGAFPAQDAELHRQIAELEARDPDSRLGWEEWGLILGSIVSGGLMLMRSRDKKYVEAGKAKKGVS